MGTITSWCLYVKNKAAIKLLMTNTVTCLHTLRHKCFTCVLLKAILFYYISVLQSPLTSYLLNLNKKVAHPITQAPLPHRVVTEFNM